MNKNQIFQVLEACALSCDNYPIDDMIKAGLEPVFIEMGVKLYEYLKARDDSTQKWTKLW